MSALSAPQAQSLVMILRAGAGVFPALPAPVRNALLTLRLITFNTATARIELTHDGLLVAQTLVATDDARLGT